MSYFGEPLPDPKRHAAWINTAGNIHVLLCHDIYGNSIYRDAKPGTADAWDADHIVPKLSGGTDAPSNFRAVHSRGNRMHGVLHAHTLAGLKR